MRTLALTVVAVAVSASASTSASAVPERTCATHAEGPDRIPTFVRGRDLMLGRLVVAGGADGLQVENRRVKAGVLVRTGPPVTLRLSPLGATRAKLDYVHPETLSSAVRFRTCDPAAKRFSDGRTIGPWTPYPGGFRVSRRGCARLTATSQGRRIGSGVIALGVPVARCR
jgi:hypothetical protein